MASSLTIKDAAAIARECPAVHSAAPVVRVRTQIAYRNHIWVPLYVYGTTSGFLDVQEWADLADGEAFTAADVRQSRPVCLLGQTVARTLFPDQSPIGAQVSLGAIRLRVIGVLRPKGSNFIGLDQDDAVLVPWTTAQYRLNARAVADIRSQADRLYPVPALDLSGTPENRPAAASSPASSIGPAQIVVRAESPQELSEARRQVTDLLRERHRIPAGQPNDFHLTEVAGPAAPR
jgi:ABC-type antimicrobial peptide transport system permease subunit